MTKVWDEAGKTLISQIAATGAPALVFWSWAITVWFLSHGGWAKAVSNFEPLLTATSGTPLFLTVTFAAIVLTLSGVLVNRATAPVLRLLEGYWPRPARGLARCRIRHWTKTVNNLEKAPVPAGPTVGPSTSAEDVVVAERRLRSFPASEDVLPTRIGNIVRAGERHALYWYGLDAIILWPQLWLVLPEQPRTDITTARNTLDRGVTAFIWATMSIPLAGWWLPAAPLGLVAAGLIWGYWIPAAAANFATVLAATFDTHRFALYTAFHLPLPDNPATEREYGQQVTAYFTNGTASLPPYRHPKA